MNNCEAIREMLVLFAEEALGPGDSSLVKTHLAACEACRAELEQVRKMQAWLSDPELFQPNQDHSWELLPERLAAAARQKSRSRNLFGWSVPRWAMGMAALLVLAAATTWKLQKPAQTPPEPLPVVEPAGNAAFLDRVGNMYEREVTEEYLVGCQDLLIDMMSSGDRCDGDQYDMSLAVARARRLLEKKRVLDVKPIAPDLAHTRGLCDELQNFLISVSTSQECESPDAFRSLEQFVEKEQLLLRIRLVHSGI